MAEGIKIESEKFREFREQFGNTDGSSQDTTNGSQTAENEDGREYQAAGTNPLNSEGHRQEILKKVDKVLGWAVDRLQSEAEKNDLPGIGGEEFQEDYKELCMMVVEDWSKEMADLEFLEKTPKLMLGITTAGIVATNGLALSRKKKEQNKESEDE